MSAGTRDARVLSREDCHPWARSPFTRFPFKTLGTALLWTVAAYRLLQTRFDVRARPSSADILARVGPPFSSRSLAFFCVGGMPSSEEMSIRGEPERSENLSGPTESREGLAHCESAPPRFPAGRPSSPTRCCERFGVSSAAPRSRAPFEGAPLRETGVLGLSSWPRPSFPRLPRRRTLSRRPGGLPPCRRPLRRADRSSLPFRIRSPRHAAGLFIRVALQRGGPAPLLFTALRPACA